MNRDQALAKIKKCLAVARSTSPHEAATAMRQAQALMTEHNVSDRDLSMIDVQEVHIRATSTAANLWEVALANMVADAFGCETFTTLIAGFNSGGNWERKRTYTFVGVDAAPTVGGYAFEVLSRQCAKARLEHIRKQPARCKQITKTARGDQFAVGWVSAASDLVERFASPERDAALLLAYMQEKHPNLRSDQKARDTRKGRRIDYGHTLAGYAAGEKAQLNRGVGALAPRGLLT